MLQTATHYPLFVKLIFAMVPKRMMEERKVHQELTKEKLRRRMELGKERPDLVEGLLKKREEWVQGPSPHKGRPSLTSHTIGPDNREYSSE